MSADPPPPSKRPLLPRVLLALLAAGLALLVVEGAASVFAGRLLVLPALQWLRGAPTHSTPAEPGTAGDTGLFERLGTAAPPRAPPPGDDPGLYATHPDPLVGYTLRPLSELSILGGRIRSDFMGLRHRPTPAPPADALRLVVLGDSVAFGFGLDDKAVLAARLEVVLATARGPAGAQRPVVCRTVAIPGWNHRNAVRFLLDHWDALDPDIVVYLPIANDLMDTDGVTERSLRRAAPDIAQHDPWLSVYQGLGLAWLKPALKQVLAGDAEALAALLGPPALDSDLTPESRRRYDDNAATIAQLDAQLRRHGGHLLLAPYVESSYEWRLQERLLDAVPDVPLVPLFTGIPPEFMLPDDPHPNAGTVDVLAHWIAEDLLERGWVPRGDGPPVPAVPERYRARRATAHAPDEVRAICAELRARARATLRDVVDWRSADGLGQILGGLNADGSAGARLLVLLGRPAGDGAALEVELAPIPGRADLYPLAVGVEVDGVRVGTLALQAEGTTRARWPLPAAPDPAQGPADPERAGPAAAGEADSSGRAGGLIATEVRLVPERWVVAPVRGEDTLVSFLPLRIAATSD